MLTSVTTDYEKKEYRYNYGDNSLKSVTFNDGTMYLLEYNEMGHISGRRYITGNTQSSQQIYTYSDGGMFSVTSLPDDNNYSLTFSETGDVIAVTRPGFYPDKIIANKNTYVNMEGDLVRFGLSFPSLSGFQCCLIYLVF